MNTNKENRPYILLTPGPLTTSDTVKEVMLKDWCTWDKEYNNLVQSMREKILNIGVKNKKDYTTILMQGSGTFIVESVIGSSMRVDKDKILVIINGTYGKRIVEIANILKLSNVEMNFGETSEVNLETLNQTLEEDNSITHVAVVHCETTTGRLNPIKEIGEIVKKHNKLFIVDAMSSFGGIDIKVDDLKIDFLISSANKCIQGVPGFGFAIANRKSLEICKGNAKSLSLDLYSQWDTMENNNGKWRFTSPTHVVRAFYQALLELEDEGGVKAREKRYTKSHDILVNGMRSLGFKTLLQDSEMSPIITTFYSPESPKFNFGEFYELLKEKGFVIYPGKISEADTFRIGNIGDINGEDMERLIRSISECIFW
ncbi:MAG: 2-aminoethylphosphonate--pyruvate transaminase [Fusobacteriaceae bacterium]